MGRVSKHLKKGTEMDGFAHTPPETMSGSLGTSRLSHLSRVRLTGGVTARLALTEETLRQAWRIRYEAYRSRDYIDENSSGFFTDEFDKTESSKTLIVYRHGLPAASARLCLYDPASKIFGFHSTPAFSTFKSEIDALTAQIIIQDRSVRGIEVMRLVRHPDFERDHEVLFALLMAIGYIILDFNAHLIFSGVRSNHIPFYRRFGFTQITEARPYPKLKFQTALIAFIKGSDNTRKSDIRIFEEVSKDDPQYMSLVAGDLTAIERRHAQTPVNMTKAIRQPVSGANQNLQAD